MAEFVVEHPVCIIHALLPPGQGRRHRRDRIPQDRENGRGSGISDLYLLPLAPAGIRDHLPSFVQEGHKRQWEVDGQPPHQTEQLPALHKPLARHSPKRAKADPNRTRPFL
jgi:hypothetical protein